MREPTAKRLIRNTIHLVMLAMAGDNPGLRRRLRSWKVSVREAGLHYGSLGSTVLSVASTAGRSPQITLPRSTAVCSASSFLPSNLTWLLHLHTVVVVAGLVALLSFFLGICLAITRFRLSISVLSLPFCLASAAGLGFWLRCLL